MEIEITRIPGKCPRCGKRNHVFAPDDKEGTLCDDCLKELMESSATVICDNCKKVAAFIKPGVCPNGFEFVKDKVYNCERCASCDKNIQELVIKQMKKWEEDHEQRE